MKSKNYLAAKEAGKEPAFDMKLEAMIPVLKKEIPLKAHAHRADDILTAIRIAKEFDVRLTLDHCTDAPVTPLRWLPLCAGLATAEGLPQEEAWKAITINPATQMGIADRVGSLGAGKDGDLVIWTADPLTTVGGHAYKTIIDGKIVYQE